LYNKFIKLKKGEKKLNSDLIFKHLEHNNTGKKYQK